MERVKQAILGKTAKPIRIPQVITQLQEEGFVQQDVHTVLWHMIEKTHDIRLHPEWEMRIQAGEGHTRQLFLPTFECLFEHSPIASSDE
jgi:hypothetical protein